MSFFLGQCFGIEPSEAHIHARHIPIKQIPSSEKDVTTWLMDTFQFKGQLLSDFIANGQFPRQGTEEELSILNASLILPRSRPFAALDFAKKFLRHKKTA
ncbi:hypothetical protein ACH5RR_035101 [Cinchona calisaya]|uniref:1-acylglycerol-3-phosphate O-acyltransferase n=1 Tax=Cinchona calisaya TaxID=153742 RepID=A0ABD2YGE0_9GENT